MPFAVSPEVVAQAAVNCLAVGGAFLLGRWLTGAVLYLLAPKSPPGVRRLGQLLGGLGLAVLVAIVVFGHGLGWTLFGGGSTGLSKGNGPSEQKGEGAAPAAPTPATPSTPTPPTTSDAGPKVRVTVLGGTDVQGGRFYRVDADPAALTFAELTAALDGKTVAGQVLKAEIVFPASNTLPRDHPAVTRLTGWAADHKVTVTFPAP